MKIIIRTNAEPMTDKNVLDYPFYAKKSWISFTVNDSASLFSLGDKWSSFKNRNNNTNRCWSLGELWSR